MRELVTTPIAIINGGNAMTPGLSDDVTDSVIGAAKFAFCLGIAQPVDADLTEVTTASLFSLQRQACRLRWTRAVLVTHHSSHVTILNPCSLPCLAFAHR